MRFFSYYIAFLLLQSLLGFGFSLPMLAGAAVVVIVVRRWLPDPYLYLKHAGRVRSLKADIAVNAGNVTARRDLAKVWLEKRRPRRAVPLLEQARQRDGESAELALLLGRALLESGRAEASLPLLVEAEQKNERQLYGAAYLLAGRALLSLDRAAEAEDALRRYLAIQSSSVQAHVLCARAARAQGDREGARRAVREALDTFAHIPGFRRRGELRWYLRAQLMRVGIG